MSEVKEMNKESKSPVDSAVNAIREQLTKTLQSKINDKVKAVRDADKIAATLRNELRDLIKEYEIEKVELNEFIKGLK